MEVISIMLGLGRAGEKNLLSFHHLSIKPRDCHADEISFVVVKELE